MRKCLYHTILCSLQVCVWCSLVIIVHCGHVFIIVPVLLHAAKAMSLRCIAWFTFSTFVPFVQLAYVLQVVSVTWELGAISGTGGALSASALFFELHSCIEELITSWEAGESIRGRASLWKASLALQRICAVVLIIFSSAKCGWAKIVYSITFLK